METPQESQVSEEHAAQQILAVNLEHDSPPSESSLPPPEGMAETVPQQNTGVPMITEELLSFVVPGSHTKTLKNFCKSQGIHLVYKLIEEDDAFVVSATANEAEYGPARSPSLDLARECCASIALGTLAPLLCDQVREQEQYLPPRARRGGYGGGYYPLPYEPPFKAPRRSYDQPWGRGRGGKKGRGGYPQQHFMAPPPPLQDGAGMNPTEAEQQPAAQSAEIQTTPAMETAPTTNETPSFAVAPQTGAAEAQPQPTQPTSTEQQQQQQAPPTTEPAAATTHAAPDTTTQEAPAAGPVSSVVPVPLLDELAKDGPVLSDPIEALHVFCQIRKSAAPLCEFHAQGSRVVCKYFINLGGNTYSAEAFEGTGGRHAARLATAERLLLKVFEGMSSVAEIYAFLTQQARSLGISVNGAKSTEVGTPADATHTSPPKPSFIGPRPQAAKQPQQQPPQQSQPQVPNAPDASMALNMYCQIFNNSKFPETKYSEVPMQGPRAGPPIFRAEIEMLDSNGHKHVGAADANSKKAAKGAACYALMVGLLPGCTTVPQMMAQLEALKAPKKPQASPYYKPSTFKKPKSNFTAGQTAGASGGTLQFETSSVLPAQTTPSGLQTTAAASQTAALASQVASLYSQPRAPYGQQPAQDLGAYYAQQQQLQQQVQQPQPAMATVPQQNYGGYQNMVPYGQPHAYPHHGYSYYPPTS